MEIIFLKLMSVALIVLGVVVFLKGEFVLMKLKAFYSNYPLIRYAGDKQLSGRLIFIRIAAIVICIVGILGFIST